MADLKVSYANLEHSERSLSRIATELRGAEARQDAGSDVWGSPDVVEAMSNFVGNWDRHREQLVESLTSVGEMCAAARHSFAGSDRQLGGELGDAGQG